MNYQQELLFDLIETYADVNIFFDRQKDNFKAKGAAIIISSDAVGHFPKRRGDKYTVWFGRGIERWTFKTFKEATSKVSEMLQKVSTIKEVEITFRIEGKNVKRFNKLFAKVLEGDTPK
jgi:hypothetical protein